MTSQVRLELEQILNELLDGTLTEEQHARLESILAADEECRRHYLEFVDLHARLLATPGLPPPAEPAAAAAPPTRRGRTAARNAVLVALTLAISLLLQLLWWKPWRAGPTPGPVMSASGALTTVATLTQTTDSSWDAGGRRWKPGDRVGTDELRLSKGLARLRFDSGPELVLEAPTVLHIDAAAAATLRSGKVVFRADATGPPFELHTPNSTLVDLGTEYGVFVSMEGEEVHVFDGEVRRTPRAGDGEPERLAAGDARRYTTVAAAPASLDEKKFVRRLPGTERPDPAAGLLAYEAFDYDDPAALAKGGGTGGFGWAGAWRGPQVFFKPGPRPSPRQQALNTSDGLKRPGSDGVGGSFQYTGFTKYSRRLETPLPLDQDATYYLSFLFRRQRPPPDAYNAFVLALKPADDGPFDREGFCKRLSLGIGGENQLFTHLHGIGSRVPLPLGYGSTYLLVAKIVANRTGPCQVFIRVYGAEERVERDEPSHWTAAGRPIRSDLTLSWVEIHINGRRSQQIDEIRLGTTWSSVTASDSGP